MTTYPFNDYRYYLQHSAKGQTWTNHKYIEIRNGRYIYEENPTDEKVKEFNAYRRRKKNAKKVLKRMKRIDNDRMIKALLNRSLMAVAGTSKGKQLAEEQMERASNASKATYSKENRR